MTHLPSSGSSGSTYVVTKGGMERWREGMGKKSERRREGKRERVEVREVRKGGREKRER